MLILVIGGSGSGKSAYAENRAIELAGDNGQLYYLATMAVHDDEMRRKVQRHQRIRAGKGWRTLEYPVDIGNATACLIGHLADASIPEAAVDNNAAVTAQTDRKRVILLEDLGNLVANEMFRDGKSLDSAAVCNKISGDINQLLKHSCSLIIVSNQVFDDGISYDSGTEEYIRALDLLHRRLAAEASEVTEVVVGIPVELKEKIQ